MFKNKIWKYILVFGFLVSLICTPASFAIKPGAGFPFLMDYDKENLLRKAIPQINHAYFNKLIDGFLPAQVIFYTDNEIPFAHQDHGVFHASQYNYSVDHSQPGNNFEFPWKHAGGCDNANVFTWKVMVLPNDTKIKVY